MLSVFHAVITISVCCSVNICGGGAGWRLARKVGFRCAMRGFWDVISARP